MGCVNSRTDINDLHPNIFQVMNVDDLGNLITPGRLQVTDVDIVLYQRGKQPVKWPLRCLRRYGYDAEIFSFESGRRCSTGPGIYAFKCRRAAQLFNLVQRNIQVCNNSGDDAISREIPISAPSVTRVTISSDQNYLDPIAVGSNVRTGARFPHSQQNGIGRLSSIGSSSGPLSPRGTMSSPSPPPILPPPPPPPSIPHLHPSSLYVNEQVLSSTTMEIEHNNNKSLRRTMQRSRTVSSVSSETMSLQPNQDVTCQNKTRSASKACYMNVDINGDVGPLSPSLSDCDSIPLRDESNDVDNISGRAYMNITPGQELLDSGVLKPRPPPLPPMPLDVEEGPRHCYANLEANENLRKRFSGVFVSDKSCVPPSTPPSSITRQVNYAVLDLDGPAGSASDGASNTAPSPPDSPNKSQKRYATIDFDKTVALSHSVNPNLVNDNEGSRKTRHNSTINDFTSPTRNSSSISE